MNEMQLLGSILDLLEQDEVWRPKDSEEVVRLKSMDSDHLRNLEAWLRRRAQKLQWAAEFTRMQWDDGFCGFDGTALGWIAQQPLYIKIVKTLKKRDKAARREFIADYARNGRLGWIAPRIRHLNERTVRYSAFRHGVGVHFDCPVDRDIELWVYHAVRHDNPVWVASVALIDEKGKIYAESMRSAG